MKILYESDQFVVKVIKRPVERLTDDPTGDEEIRIESKRMPYAYVGVAHIRDVLCIMTDNTHVLDVDTCFAKLVAP
ncbi:MAG: hypothetical protein Q8Q48_04650 [Candidatus Staskawiczbacteria bacterium]|nr:hypothetical protein [Candidatus Staskawiczbacteria bacterium]